jgi:peptidyl-prolyl cis-trans isomerase C
VPSDRCLISAIRNTDLSHHQYSAPSEGIKATARHILVKSKVEADGVLDKIAAGLSFASLASEFSTCPSSARGGSLGSFSPGTMVPEFDKTIFSPATIIGEVVGPIETKVRSCLLCVVM